MKDTKIMYIMRSDVTNDERNKENQFIKEYINKINGKTLKIESLGEQRLAYKMKGLLSGYYYLLTLTGDNECLKKLDDMMKERNMVLNHMIMWKENKNERIWSNVYLRTQWKRSN